MSLLYRKKLAAFDYRTYSSEEQDFFQGDEGKLCYRVKQIHSKDLVQLSAQTKKEELQLNEADGLIVHYDDFRPLRPSLQITTADCLPIAVMGRKGYSHLHAGWRGLQQNILDQSAIRDLEPMLFFIGPCILPCCYEVHVDFIKNFQNFSQYPFLKDCFFGRGEKFYFDLVLFASSQVRFLHPQAGVLSSGICTACEKKFASYRRNQTVKRNQNILIPL